MVRGPEPSADALCRPAGKLGSQPQCAQCDASVTFEPLNPRRSVGHSGKGALSRNGLAEDERMHVVRSFVRVHALQVGHVT